MEEQYDLGSGWHRDLAPVRLTPLQLAAAFRRPAATRALLKAGADPNTRGTWFGALHVAVMATLFRFPHISRQCLPAREPLTAAEQKRGVRTVRALVRAGAMLEGDYEHWHRNPYRNLETPLEAFEEATRVPQKVRLELQDLLTHAHMTPTPAVDTTGLFDLD